MSRLRGVPGLIVGLVVLVLAIAVGVWLTSASTTPAVGPDRQGDLREERQDRSEDARKERQNALEERREEAQELEEERIESSGGSSGSR